MFRAKCAQTHVSCITYIGLGWFLLIGRVSEIRISFTILGVVLGIVLVAALLLR